MMMMNMKEPNLTELARDLTCILVFVDVIVSPGLPASRKIVYTRKNEVLKLKQKLKT